MIRSILKSRAAKFGREFDYDVSYLDGLIDADPAAAAKYAAASSFLESRCGLPALVWHTAKLRSVMAADCGPCLRLAVTMAEREGIKRDVCVGVLRGHYPNAASALAGEYADAVVVNAAAQLEIIERARKAFGERGLAGLSIAVLSGQFYPLFKRGLGHGQTCIPVLRELEAA